MAATTGWKIQIFSTFVTAVWTGCLLGQVGRLDLETWNIPSDHVYFLSTIKHNQC